MKIGNEDVKLYLGSAEVEKIYLGTEQVYGGEPTPPHDYSQDYLTIESLQDNNTISFRASNITLTKTISASTDNGVTWRSYTSSTGAGGTTIATLDTGEKVLLKGVNSAYANSNNNANYFISSSRFNVYGNIMSLISGDSFANATTLTGVRNLAYLFYNCGLLISAENLVLPATTLAVDCYYYMFNGCTSLTTAPELPATTLAESCYYNMFYGCTNLTTAPELPATTLAVGCYNQMFYGCTSLTAAPELPATTLVEYCYGGMFYGCTSLTTAPELPATTLVTYCYNQMFYGCTSLTAAPELHATTLARGCYGSMFYGCTSLTTAPELPATTLAEQCYTYMFYGCTSLNYIKCLATDISASNCTSNWVDGVAATGTFVKAESMFDWTRGINGIPDYWMVEDDIGLVIPIDFGGNSQ